jgi:hypothetical protein
MSVRASMSIGGGVVRRDGFELDAVEFAFLAIGDRSRIGFQPFGQLAKNVFIGQQRRRAGNGFQCRHVKMVAMAMGDEDGGWCRQALVERSPAHGVDIDHLATPFEHEARMFDRMNDEVALAGGNRLGHGWVLSKCKAGAEKIGRKSGYWQAGHAGNDRASRNHTSLP